MPVADLTSAKYFIETVQGKAGISWKSAEKSFEMALQVPVGSTAIVYIPASADQKITENNQPLGNRKDVEILNYESGYQLVKIGSGKYSFKVIK